MRNKVLIEQEETLRAHLTSQGVNLFLGAGFSVLANDSKGRGLPLVRQLRDELVAEFKQDSLKSLDLDRLYDVLHRKDAKSVESYLTSRFTVASFNEKYESLRNVIIDSIIITNIDNLIQRIYADNADCYIHDMVASGARHRDSAAIDFIPLHGHVTHSEPHYTFGTTDLATAFARDPDKFRFLTERLQRKPIIFWGFSLRDPGPLQALDSRTIAGRTSKERWIVLDKPEDGAEEYYRSQNFFVIRADTESILDYFSKFHNQKTERISGLPTSLKTARIPTIGEVSTRPLASFFRGDPPIWHDALSNRMPHTSHYTFLSNRVHRTASRIALSHPA